MSQPRDQIAPATDLFDCYVPRTGFVLSSAMQGIAVRGQPAAVVAVSPGPDQVARAAALASSALAAAGPNAVITGALPFDGAPVAFLQVAGDVVRSESPLAQFDLHAAERPQVVNTAHEPDEAAYEDAVAEALRSISDGSVDKVVLARTLVIETDQALDPGTIARSLRAADPSAYVFAVGLPGSAHALVGASPELVVRRRGMRVASDPLAGSAPRDVNAAKDRSNGQALLDSVKDRREHRIVADAVADTLAPFCSELEVDRQPSLHATATLWHLRTSIRGRLRDDSPDALTLAAALHPTPAVCGMPPDAALSLIRELEPFDRRFYAGIVGWVDARGDGEWVIALRCAEIMGRTARLYAGAGIVSGSDPAAEDREADVKFGAMLRALGVAQPSR